MTNSKLKYTNRILLKKYYLVKKDKSVFIADDDEDDIYLFKEAVEKSADDVKVVDADSGEELVEMLRDAVNLSDR
ncbi:MULTISPECIES: hypothetical protein [Dyadobacter]|uniref:Response regulator n=1 Tax=Dyadobacter sediminis TaxID=1493691 RepID=A0A5R9K2Y0_9BACT|nr:hypothetical protein [Dyadobacter sediminis]TLU88713.1 hypothetical protein FEM55_24725 [Dyadobacter sediminis]GGC14097.1 hypothetical protein GCM10011325_46290 [Dyadobacter sediminis]